MKRVLAFAAVAGLPIVLLLGACTTDSLVGANGACFQSIDCQPGLVCIPQNDAGICSSNLNNIVVLPPEAGSDTAQPDVTLNDGPVDQAVQDNFVQDTSTQDTSTQDTGSTDAGGG